MSSAFGDHRRRQHHHDPHHQQYRHRGSKIYAEHGTPYSCTQATIDKLQDMNLLPRTYPDIHMSIGEATRRLESAHRPGKSLNSGQKAALKRLQDLEKVGKYGPDIVLKIFNDLDTLLFQGVLNGNIYLCWSSDDAFGASGTAGSLSRPGRIAKRAAISLNKDILQLSTTRLRDVISTLVHECVVSHP